MPDLAPALQPFLLAGASLVAGAGLPALLAYRGSRRQSLFPRAAPWPIVWNGWAVLVACLFVFIIPSLIQSLLSSGGFYQAIYGPAFPQPAPDDWRFPERLQDVHLRGLWSQTLAVPFQLFFLVAGFVYGLNATWSQIGLPRGRLRQNYVLGYLGWLVLTPLCFGLFMLAVVLLAPNAQKHPLMDLGPLAGRRELIVFALQAALLVPILEEFVFRGLLLPWLLEDPKGETPVREAIVPPAQRGHVCYGIAFFLSLQSPALTEAYQQGNWPEVFRNLAPIYFLLAMLPIYLFAPFAGGWRRRLKVPTPQAARALLANAILFAAVHSNVWPTPIPLVVLGFGLAWLSFRTRSIVPGIVVHALFNSVAVVYMFAA